jgi:RNA-binding protein
MHRGALTAKQRRFLRAKGHHLEPLVQIGKDGVTEGVCAELDHALTDHELVKIRVLESSPAPRAAAAARLAGACRAEIAGEIGRTALLYRPHPEKPRIQLPGSGPSR